MICDVDTYRRITHDNDTADADVELALADAQAFLEDETERGFELAERTEVLHYSADGYVYPSTTPIVSVSAPANSTIDGGRVRTGSHLSVSIGSSDTATLTYTAGYAEGEFPRHLVSLVARLAYAGLPHTSNVPEGATSVTVGDVSYTIASAVSSDTSLNREVRRWDRKRLEVY